MNNPLKTFGGPLDVKVEVDTPWLDEGTFGVYDVSTYDSAAVYGAKDPEWTDVTPYVFSVTTFSGKERWEDRFGAASASFTLDNAAGIWTPDTSQPTPWYLPWRPGRRIRVIVIPDPTLDPGFPESKSPIFTGEVDAAQDRFDGAAFDLTTQVTAFDFLARLNRINPIAMETATGNETTDERVLSALERADWPIDKVDIQTGVHSVQTSFLAQSVGEECQRAAEAEGGVFFMSADGVATFKARDWLTTDTRSVEIQGYLGYGEDTPIDSQSAQILAVLPSWETARIRNDIQLARVGGSVYQVEDEASLALYDRRSYRRLDYQNNVQAQIEFLANRFLLAFKDNRMRVDSVTIAPNPDPNNEDLNRLLWDSQFGDKVAIRVQTGHGWSYELISHVMGIGHHITSDDWVTTLKLDDSSLAGSDNRLLMVGALDPAAWWRFNEASGTTTADSSGNAHTLTWSGSPTLAGSGGPNATGLITLDGVNDYATVGSEVSLELRQDMSIECWIRGLGTSTFQTVIEAWASANSLYTLWAIGDYQYGYAPSFSGSNADYFDGYIPGTWAHVVLTIEWGSERIVRSYVNGVPKTTNSYTYFPPVATRTINVGRPAGSGGYWNGDFGELVIYDRVLTSQQILDLYNASY